MKKVIFDLDAFFESEIPPGPIVLTVVKLEGIPLERCIPLNLDEPEPTKDEATQTEVQP